MKLRVRGSAVGARHVVPLQPRHLQYASAIIEFAGSRRQIREKSGLARRTTLWRPSGTPSDAGLVQTSEFSTQLNFRACVVCGEKLFFPHIARSPRLAPALAPRGMRPTPRALSNRGRSVPEYGAPSKFSSPGGNRVISYC